MTRLTHIRGQLSSLRRARAAARILTGYSGLLITLLWSLIIFCLIDVLFELDVLQRLVIWIPTVLLVWWSFRQFVKPMLGVKESDLGMALQVEQRHGIRSDLIAAIQFDGPQAATWGSAQLENAVIEYVSDLGQGLRVFAGFSRAQLWRRASSLLVTATLVVGGFVCFPNYALVFMNRLALGSMHYPTRTRIDLIVVNNQIVLDENQAFYNRLSDVKCAQGHPVEFYVKCHGVLPDLSEVQLASSASGQRRSIELQPANLARRKQWLVVAQRKIERAVKDVGVDIQGPWNDEMTRLLGFDAEAARSKLSRDLTRKERLRTALAAVNDRLSDWPGQAAETAIYVGRMERVVDELNYKVMAGDAWTEAGKLTLIPLPVVQIRLLPKPPEYARDDGTLASTAERNLSVLIGSDVDVEIEATNNKPLQAAWLIARTEKEVQRYDLRQDGSRLKWRLDGDKTLFGKIRHEVRFELQASDEDGLHLESPIRGVIRIKPDRPPRGVASVIHRVVLPAARPVVRYRVNDDYGIRKVVLVAQVERQNKELYANDDSDVQHKNEETTYTLLDEAKPIKAGQLPYGGKIAIDLQRLKLKKGDRLKLTLAVTDDRGKSAGQSYRADPLFLEVSDKAGVLSAISEADEQSEKQLNDVIDRQIGIGGSQ